MGQMHIENFQQQKISSHIMMLPWETLINSKFVKNK